MRKINFLFALLFALRLPCAAQLYTFENFRFQDENYCIEIYDDNVWLGSAISGVVRTDLDGNVISRLSKDDGLADNKVNDIYAEAADKIWFATEAGLSFFDGVSWMTHLNGQKVSSVAQATDGRIWCTANGLAQVMNPMTQSWTSFDITIAVDESVFKNAFTRVRACVDGRMLLCSQSGLVVKESNSDEFKAYPTLDYVGSQGIAVGVPNLDALLHPDGKIYSIIQGNLGVINGNSLNYMPGLPALNSSVMTLSFAGDMYTGAKDGLRRINVNQPQVEAEWNQAEYAPVLDFPSRTTDQYIYFSTLGGFVRHDGTGFNFYRIEPEKTLASRAVHQIEIDASGEKWFFGGKFTTLKGNQWTAYSGFSKDGYSVQDFALTPYGERYVLEKKSWNKFRMKRYANGTETIFPQSASFYNMDSPQIEWDPFRQKVMGVNSADDALFWECDANGNLGPVSFVPAPNNQGDPINCNINNKLLGFDILPDGSYFWMDETQLDRTVISNTGAIQYKVNGITGCALDVCACNRFYDVKKDGQNRYWFATGGGVFRQDAPDQALELIFDRHNSPLPDDLVRCLSVSASGAIWMGTSYGLAIYDPLQGWQIFDRSTGLASDTVLTIVQENANLAWVGTADGISRVSWLGVDTSDPDFPGLSISPNPANAQIRVSWPASISPTRLHIVDAQGKLVHECPLQSDGQSADISTQAMAAGLYFIRLDGSRESISGKFMKR